MMRKNRYIWLPILLFLYGLTFALWFGKDFIQSGKTLQLIIAVSADFIICCLLFFALKKRDKLRNS